MKSVSKESAVKALVKQSERAVTGAGPRSSSISPGPELTVIVPTLNERDNIVPLIERLTTVLAGITWEVIFVDDDSQDGTANQIRGIARTDMRVRCLQRIGRRGLATACIEGALASAAPYLAVIDGDLQHDETILPQMLEALQREYYDVAIGSRYIAGGSVGDWDPRRIRISRFATWLSSVICKAEITDPMSGFFMLRRAVFEAAARHLSGQGFKILLDLLASSPQPLRIKELPYQFRERRFGESKLDILVGWEFLMLVADKLVGGIVPVRFALFALIGGIGLLVHLFVLWSCFHVAGISFVWSQSVATLVAMTFNFFMNNLLTYRDQRLTGTFPVMRGLFVFYAVCSIGAIANVGVASVLFKGNHAWWLSGIAGILVGAVWNYTASSVFTWRLK